MEQRGVNRRQVLGMGMGMAAAGAGLAVTQPGIAHGSARTVTADPVPRIEAGIAWYDVQQWGVEGRGWDDTEAYYDRFPARAKATVRPEVWNLSRQSAGMLTRFESDSRVFQARYTLRSPSLALPHMPATGVSGLDLYARDDDGRDRWLSVTKPTARPCRRN
jgi:N-terminus of Esterase_SGNH_hydro-type